MVFVDVALLALVLGKLLGGRLSALADTPIRDQWLVFVRDRPPARGVPGRLLPWSTPSAVASGRSGSSRTACSWRCSC